MSVEEEEGAVMGGGGGKGGARKHAPSRYLLYGTPAGHSYLTGRTNGHCSPFSFYVPQRIPCCSSCRISPASLPQVDLAISSLKCKFDRRCSRKCKFEIKLNIIKRLAVVSWKAFKLDC